MLWGKSYSNHFGSSWLLSYVPARKYTQIQIYNDIYNQHIPLQQFNQLLMGTLSKQAAVTKQAAHFVTSSFNLLLNNRKPIENLLENIRSLLEAH